MKYFLSGIVLASLFAFSYIDDIYSLSIKKINGQTISLSTYKGKKILFVIVPIASTDTTIRVNELAALQAKYLNTLVVIGIPAEETGYTQNAKTALQNMYSTQPSNFILAEGIKVKKGAGASQDAVFAWLTNKDRNRIFNQDVHGVGHKFFVNEAGRLFAVVSSKTKLTNPAIDRIITTPLPGTTN